MNHDRRTKSGLIREHTALKAPCNSIFYCKSNGSAADSAESEGKGEDCAEHFASLSNVCEKYDQCAEYVSTCHKRNKFFSKLGNSFNAAYNYKPCKNHQADTNDESIEINFNRADQKAAVQRLDFEHRGNIACNGIYLTHISDTKRSEDTEDGKQDGKYFSDCRTALFGAKAVS